MLDVLNPFASALAPYHVSRPMFILCQLEGVKIKSLEEYEKRLYSPFDSEEEVK